MKRKKYLLVYFAILLAVESQSQTPLGEAEVSLTSSLSEIVLGKAAKELPALLIESFQNGELKAYRFGFQKKPVYGELRQWPNPEPWAASRKYDKDDSVLYEGKLYRYQIKRNEPGVIQVGKLIPDIAPDANGVNDYWMEYKRIPPVVGMNYNLPTEKDLLKPDKWNDVKSKGTMPIPYWDPNKEYFAAEVVIYQGHTYEAIRNDVKSPPTNQNDWTITNRGISDDTFTQLHFIYNTETRLPIAFQLSLEGNSEICIGFYFEAVQKYLTQTQQEELADKLEGLMRERAR